jgi:glycosyltransferase involved in cell wall biosynthesis
VLKVLQLIPTLDRSGAEKQMVLLANGLPRDRFAVEVAALTRLGPLEAELHANNISVTLIGKKLKADPFALTHLIKFMKAHKFDVVQTWIFAANTYGRIAARQAHVPAVIVSEMAVDLWKGRAQLSVDRFLARWTDCLVGNSNAVVDYYREKAGLTNEKLAMIPSGIGDDEPPQIDRNQVRHSLGIADDAPVVLFVGRLAPQKAVHDLISAVDILQHGRPDLRTLIVGDGPLRERLEEQAESFGLLGKVQFLGHRADVPTLLAASDLLVLPSLYEGLPNVVLEAMRFRKPVVATAAPGTTEVVKNGETGLLVPMKSPTELARAIRQVIDDPDLASRLGTAGRRRVETEFRASLMVERFADLYEKLATAKGVAI